MITNQGTKSKQPKFPCGPRNVLLQPMGEQVAFPMNDSASEDGRQSSSCVNTG